MNNTYSNEMKIEFLSKSNNEAFARIAVAAFVAQLDPTLEEIADIKTAVSEAVTNSIIHGYEEKIGIVRLSCKIIDKEVMIEISDRGKGIENVEIAKQPLYTTKANLERSGMGFTIMESFMDDVEEMQSNEKEKEKDNRKPQTNIDRIRTMSEEELAAVLMCPYDVDETSFGEKIPCYQNDRQELVTEEECRKCCVNWLKSEVKE